MPAGDHRIAVDIGGTFTDVVLEHDGGHISTKVLTTRPDPADGVMAGLATVLESTGVSAEQVGLVLHGTTLATNALIERSGARTALLTTLGHRDAIEMALENRFEQYDIGIDRPRPLVPRPLRLPIRERLDSRGKVLVDLDPESVREAAVTLRAHNVESVAIGFLHAYANPEHEQRTAALIAEELPEVSISLSSAVCPEIREYERLSTTCANAYVKPLMAHYLESLEAKLAAAGFACPVLLMTSGGGLTTLAAAREFPIRLVESGPAGGAILSSRISQAGQFAETLSFDMGGTTAKLCVIDDGKPLLSRAFEVDRSYRFKKGSGLPVRIPVIEMVEIGAGGGSIAKVDALQRIRVGPASAGSQPGPACYGQGGSDATVTDADLILGKIDPAGFAGGRMALDLQAAAGALAENVANPLGLTNVHAAHAVGEVVGENMAAAARAHLAEWGKALSGRTLIAFGGAAPLHASLLAHKLKLDRVVVPRDAGVGSAIGFLLAPVSYEVVRSRYMRLDEMDRPGLEEIMSEMREEARGVIGDLVESSQLATTRRAFMRYLGQGYEIPVPLDDNPQLDEKRLRLDFEAEYRRLYGRTIPGLAIEILSWTLALSGLPEGPHDRDGVEERNRVTTPVSRQVFDVVLAEEVEAGCYERNNLRPGDFLDGPALVVEEQTTTFVASGFTAVVSAHGHLVLTR
jgi:N-methylhydantoinase A